MILYTQNNDFMYTNSDFIYKISDFFMFLVKTSNDDPHEHTYARNGAQCMRTAAVGKPPRAP